MNGRSTIFKEALFFPDNTSCRYYDKPSYNVEVTLEENLSCAIKQLRAARRENRAGVKNKPYLKWCERNLKKAIKLCRQTERIEQRSNKNGNDTE